VVAHQALFFMNSQLVRDCARSLAESLCARDPVGSRRMETAYLRLFGRFPTADETTRARRFLDHAAPLAGPDPVAAWAALCQSLLSANEFLYLE